MVTRRDFLCGMTGIGGLRLTASTNAAEPARRPARTDKGCKHPLSIEGNVPRSRFGKLSTAEEVTKGIDLTGRVAIITGSTSGIGLETLRVLLLRGAKVYALGRTQAKAEAACASAFKPEMKGTAIPIGCEQSQFESVVSCADAIRKHDLPVDMLICNAGLNVPTLQQVNGIEMHFAVQHLSHFILVLRLMNNLKMAQQGRVVMVSSCMYKDTPPGGIDFTNLSGERGPYLWAKMYGQSKLANGLFVRELTRRSCGTKVTANVLHPGLISTNIGHVWNESNRDSATTLTNSEFRNACGDDVVKTLGQGAATQCYVATSPDLAGVSGQYFEDCHVVKPVGYMQDDALASKLWRVSEDLVGRYLKGV